MTGLLGRICVITGAGGLIGRAMVHGFKSAGATIIALDTERLEIPAVDSVVCDLGDLGSIAEFEAYARGKYGRIDCLVNNGAIGGGRAPLHDKPVEEFDDVMRINVRGLFLLSQAALRLHLRDPQTKLDIINVSSILASRPVALASIYSASKAAVNSLTKTTAKEYGRLNVRCNAISPGYMEVPNVRGFSDKDIASLHSAVPMGRGGRPAEVANMAVWLASDEAAYVNGAELLVDGGLAV